MVGEPDFLKTYVDCMGSVGSGFAGSMSAKRGMNVVIGRHRQADFLSGTGSEQSKKKARSAKPNGLRKNRFAI
jgi:hypothetical protein